MRSQINGPRRGIPSFALLPASLLFLSIPHPLFALNPDRSINQYNCRTWTSQNGLPANGVFAIAQPGDGYIWLGTSVGLVRFDGIDFQIPDMSHASPMRSTIVSTIANSHPNGFWFGLERGAFGFFDGKTFSFRGNDDRGGLNLNVNSVLESRAGDLWIGAETMAARLTRSGDYQVVLATNPDGNYDVTATFEDSHGRIWLGTVRQGLFYWLNGTLTRFPDPTLDGHIIRCIAEDHQGQIWVGTEIGFKCYDPQFQARKDLPFPFYETRALLVDRQGSVWIATTGGGLYRYGNRILGQLKKSEGLADDFVLSLAEDDEGDIWVGTRNGLSELTDVKIPTFTRSEELPADLDLAVTPSRKGGLWVGTDQGFDWFTGNIWDLYPNQAGIMYSSRQGMFLSLDYGLSWVTNYGHVYSTNDGLSYAYVKDLLETKNGDLYIIDGKMTISVLSGNHVVAAYTNTEQPTALVEDPHGVVVSIRGDLFRVDSHSLKPYPFKDDNKPPLNWVFNMASGRDGSIWIASSDGLCRVKDGTYSLWTTQQGLPDNKVNCVCEDSDGVIWAGLERGIARLKDGQLRIITRDNGLFDNIIFALVPDDRGSLWAHASRGFFQVGRRALNDFADGTSARVECVSYTGINSVKTAEIGQGQQSGCKTLDGRIWFPTSEGIAAIDPARMALNQVPPKVHIHNVLANGRALDPSQPATVPPGKGELEFHYTGLSYAAPQLVQYRYKLDGYDKDWVDAGTRRVAFYTNLKPGNYRFQVEARNEDGVGSGANAGFTLQLLPHYYQTRWFAAAMSFAALSFLFGIYVWRVKHLTWRQRQLQEAHDLLETKVEERTSELKNEIEERKRMQVELERIHHELVDASRKAGQAEVASSVLHNVGNVLNSVNVSASVIATRVRDLKPAGLSRLGNLLAGHREDLAHFLAENNRYDQVVRYLTRFTEQLGAEQSTLLDELNCLTGNIEHIKEIVAMQQNYARVSGLLEKHSIAGLIEDALRVQATALLNYKVQVVRDFDPVPEILLDKHKILQILVNLISNAGHAMAECTSAQRVLTIGIHMHGDDAVRVSVVDTGVGIPAENLTRIFSHGFTTRPGGHGFGLHSGALAARQMGWSLTAHSDGPGKGATFLLDLPFQSELDTTCNPPASVTNVA